MEYDNSFGQTILDSVKGITHVFSAHHNINLKRQMQDICFLLYQMIQHLPQACIIKSNFAMELNLAKLLKVVWTDPEFYHSCS